MNDDSSIVSVVAPAGYGKTTLLTQWAEQSEQPFAWVSVTEGDNDSKILLGYAAKALNNVEPIDRRVFDALASPSSSVPGSVVPRLSSAFSAMTTTVVLVLDDVHLLHDFECRAAVSVLADHVRPGSRLVLAGRDEPPLRVARLRAEGRILEVGPSDLALTVEEAAWLLREAGVTLSADDVAELLERTEGWAAGLYLAALAMRAGGSSGMAAFFGDDVCVRDYVESAFLARIPPRQREFLTRTAPLERMCGPLCDAVLDATGSTEILEKLARSNMLLVALDHRGWWHRYHHLFRNVLLAELKRSDPQLIAVLQRRAADWCLDNDMAEEALKYSMAAEDVDTSAHLVETLWNTAYAQDRIMPRRRWIDWLDDRDAVRRRPLLSVQAAFLAAGDGRAEEADRLADMVDHWQYQDLGRPENPEAETMATGLRAFMCRHGVEQMRADADEFAIRSDTIRVHAPYVALQAPLLQGVARILCGDPDGGERFLEEAIRADDVGAHDCLAWALCERSRLAMARGEWSQAEAFASQAESVLHRAHLEEFCVAPLVFAVQARVAAHGRDAASAREQLVKAQRLRHLLTFAYPDLAVKSRVELGLVYLAVADVAGAWTLMREVDEVLTRRPKLGILVGQAESLRAQLSRQPGSGTPGASALTAAELRLLPYLQTHLTLRAIGDQLFVSRATVNSQVTSIYRKLGVSSRAEAVAGARELGLLEA